MKRREVKPKENPKATVCHRLISMARCIRKTGDAAEAAEAAEIEQLLENRLTKFQQQQAA